MAAISHKDWLSRRQRQKQGIERAHTLGKYRGKQADQERHQKVLYYRQVKKLSIRETADATGYSTSQVCRIQALYREPRQPGGCKLKTAPVRPVVAARPAEYVCSEDLFY